jgi:uncharacterized protein YciI
MGIYVYIGRDGERGLELRKTVRDRHIEAIEKLDAQGRIVFAGPLRDDTGSPCGSVIILEAEDLAAARAIAESDPYLVEGVFESVDVHESLAVFPRQRTSPGAE